MENRISPQAVGENVRLAMAQRRVDQAEIARVIGKTQPSVSDRLTGKTEFRATELHLIAQRLDVPVETLVTPLAAEAAS